jgi:hypothetical protein
VAAFKSQSIYRLAGLNYFNLTIKSWVVRAKHEIGVKFDEVESRLGQQRATFSITDFIQAIKFSEFSCFWRCGGPKDQTLDGLH